MTATLRLLPAFLMLVGAQGSTLRHALRRYSIVSVSHIRVRTNVAAIFVCLGAWCSQAAGQASWWSLERTLTIGGASSEDFVLTSVGSVIVRDGRVFVTQPNDHHLLVFTEAGEFNGFLGGPGEGPGEFSALDGIGVREGLIWVADADLRRISYFGPDLRFVSSSPILPHPSLPAGLPRVYGISSDGTMTIRYRRGVGQELADAEAGRPPVVLRVTEEGVLRDTLTAILGRPPSKRIAEGIRSGITLYAGFPVSDASLFAAASDGGGYLVVHRELAPGQGTHAYRVVRFGADADTLWDREVQYDPVGVPDRWLSSYLDQSLEGLSENPGPITNLNAYRRGLEAAFRERRFFPAVDAARAGDDGTTWLRTVTAVDSFEWEILDRSGHLIGRFEPPTDGRLVWPGLDAVWFVEHDELDLPYLVRYRVQRP